MWWKWILGEMAESECVFTLSEPVVEWRRRSFPVPWPHRTNSSGRPP